jgi:hypothetical protein
MEALSDRAMFGKPGVLTRQREGNEEMKYVKLGNSELNVSRNCMAVWAWRCGERSAFMDVDEEHSRGIINAGWCGVNFL